MFFSRRFFPYFVVQCLGALNDNVYKNVLLLMIAWASLDSLPMSVDLFVNLAAALFILPFLIFSAHAGHLADSRDKAWLIRRLKWIELLLMCAGAIAILTQSYLAMLGLLFLMGTQSAYFGPVKYALLPQSLAPDELVQGNAWVEVGTFMAILGGTLGAGLIMSAFEAQTISAVAVVAFALLGLIASQFIPSLPPLGEVTERKGNWQILKSVKSQKQIFIAILAISWFWFAGAIYLTQFPNFTRSELFATPAVVSLLLALFSLGIGTGSFLSVKLARGKVELGLVALGALGLMLFGCALDASLMWVNPPAEGSYTLGAFAATGAHWWLLSSLFMVGVSGGIYIVPLYSFIQAEARPAERAQVIAANNIFNALFMIGSAALAIVLLEVLGWSIPEFFLLIALANLLVISLLYMGSVHFRLAFVKYLFRRP
ncbi:MFS transporter [Shewanella submarina]|uniref:MFS transporter n=1 Tax=Shewanella submarina TaxID=2016376 RepID=A0ABV7G9G6_9GAMM|nr:MFS transporter [Shewanella submarina]MCL1039589.1 MFS transporter [Shewanella submarina]